MGSAAFGWIFPAEYHPPLAAAPTTANVATKLILIPSPGYRPATTITVRGG